MQNSAVEVNPGTAMHGTHREATRSQKATRKQAEAPALIRAIKLRVKPVEA